MGKRKQGWFGDKYRHSLSARGIPNRRLERARVKVSARAIAMMEMRLAEQRGHRRAGHTQAKLIVDRLMAKEVQAIDENIVQRMELIRELKQQKKAERAKLMRRQRKAKDAGDFRSMQLLRMVGEEMDTGRTPFDIKIRGHESVIEELKQTKQLETINLQNADMRLKRRGR